MSRSIELKGASMSSPLIRHARGHTLGDLPRRAARRERGKVAIVDGATVLSFAEFDAVVDRVAAALVHAGFSKGSRLAILSRNCWQFAVLNFATARAGVVLVPLNFMLVPGEIAYLLDASGATGFVVEDSLVPVADAALTQSAGQVSARVQIRARTADPRPGCTDLQDWLDYDGAAPEVDVADDDPIRMMFTSGTESRPKGYCCRVVHCCGNTFRVRSTVVCRPTTWRSTRCRCTTARNWTASWEPIST
jgi:fatty-acyl-CoA synthase